MPPPPDLDADTSQGGHVCGLACFLRNRGTDIAMQGSVFAVAGGWMAVSLTTTMPAEPAPPWVKFLAAVLGAAVGGLVWLYLIMEAYWGGVIWLVTLLALLINGFALLPESARECARTWAGFGMVALCCLFAMAILVSGVLELVLWLGRVCRLREGVMMAPDPNAVDGRLRVSASDSKEVRT